ncbi:MAG: cysteine hydrolase [Pantoea sp.]|uniref:Isochorismatase n=1 Tax=Pantoea brenneri TaxID=472694 RepID=A0AAX3J719_9GAMM|nr:MULTISPECIES: cysteine hydrolase family protein [Pantoea]MBS6035275.1 cysteine hydrolase [Pantoea sp.]VXB96819.1 Isochorismatase [Pantoea brenneri]
MSSSESALLVIDMQQGLFRGAVTPHYADRVLANICLLIDKARQAKVPIFFARHTGPDDSPFSARSPLTRLLPELGVDDAQEGIFIKKFPSCFRDTPLLSQLREKGIKQLVVTGMKTEFCVDTSCRAAADCGFSVVLVSDAHTTVDNPHLTAEKIIAHHNLTLAGPFVTLSAAAEWHF